MGFYSRLIFPRLCDWAMSTPEFTQLRQKDDATPVPQRWVRLLQASTANFDRIPDNGGLASRCISKLWLFLTPMEKRR
jgi:hypothetical protein